ncbi:hypothetical protein BSF42_43360 [Flavobacterium sp. ACN6]|nr:hypothetical protein BSF42_43360 [Flavobacterium sp. ACN6]
MMLLLSCGQSNEKKNKLLDKNQTVTKTFEQREKERLEKRAEIEKDEKLDSLKLDRVLSDALRIAEQNIGKNKFQKNYKTSSNIEVELDLDNHFTKDYPHLIIRRHADDIDDLYIDIYSKVDSKFEKAVSHQQWKLTYQKDTIQDINGDGLKDFVLNWYGANGCCLKAFSDIYLLRNDKKTFSKSFEFINPTFSPNEKIIRGIEYGHPGYTSIYKYKWNGEAVDTLEYVYYETDKEDKKTGKIIISKKRAYTKNNKNIKKLNSVPAEYKNIQNYDWFTGKGYE